MISCFYPILQKFIDNILDFQALKATLAFELAVEFRGQFNDKASWFFSGRFLGFGTNPGLRVFWFYCCAS
jgi:hypothetical protein